MSAPDVRFNRRRDTMELYDKVVSARKGNDNAFYDLIQERKEMLYRTAYTYVKNKEDALDIVSETVYKAYASIKKLKEPQYFSTWLTRILINCALDHVKKHSRVIPINEAVTADAESTLSNSEELMDLYSAVDKLEQKYKTIVILKYFQDLTLTQIAEVVECPVGTVKTYLHKALHELRFELKEECFNE
jgi:RNA polymerase sigma-70 factor (ECF subfamily)